MSNSTNVTKQVETTAPYTSSTNANLLACMVNTSINGVSPTSQPIISRSLDSTDYTNLVQAKQQDGIFTSKTDKKIFTIDSNLDFEFNPIKSLESNIGISYNYVSNLAAEDKDNRVQKDNIPASPYPSYGPEIYSGTNSNSPDVFIATPARNPPCIISESRTGTASYTQINERGVFSEGKEVEIRVLTSPNNYSFGTSQNFDQIEPRGSQTPQRYYNHNSGRTLSFVAEFHQQEYPLEPLLSIAEKAQYLARPYKHGDYALIPKLVMVQIPGRVFRGYLQSVTINTSGDDYSNWNFIDIKSKVGTMGEQEGFYGGYNSRELEPIGGISNDRKDIMTDNQNVYYGLSKMTIDFTLLIVEDIVLTTYETQEEIAERERIQQEEAERLIKEAERQTEIEKARQEVEANKYEFDFTPTDDCIFVDPQTGEIVGYKFTDRDGNEVEWYEGDRGGTAITLTEWEKQQEIKKGDTTTKSDSTAYVETTSDIVWSVINRANSIESMKTFLLENWLAEHPEPSAGTPEHQAWEAERNEENNRINNLTLEETMDEYKQEAITNGVETANWNMAYFCNASVNAFNSKGTQEPAVNMPLELKEFLTHSLKTTEDLHAILHSIGVDEGSHLDAEIDIQQIERNGIDDRWDFKIIIEICCQLGLQIDFSNFTKTKYLIHTFHLTMPNTTDTVGFAFVLLGSGMEYLDKNGNTKILSRRYIELLRDSGYAETNPNHAGDSWLFLSFEQLAKITDFTKLEFTTDADGKPLKKPDKTLTNFFIEAVGAIRESFYYGFKTACYKAMGEFASGKGEIYPNKEMAEYIAETENREYVYYWEYDGTGTVKGTNSENH